MERKVAYYISFHSQAQSSPCNKRNKTVISVYYDDGDREDETLELAL